MDWERFARIANRAQVPLTVSGYIAWAYVLWPKGAVLFGNPKHMNWMAVTAVTILCLGALSAASQLGLLRLHRGITKAVAAPSTQRESLLQIRIPLGGVGSVNDLLATTEYRYFQLESSF